MQFCSRKVFANQGITHTRHPCEHGPRAKKIYLGYSVANFVYGSARTVRSAMNDDAEMSPPD